MPDSWTGAIIGKMHVKRIPKKRLAEQLGYTPEYVSMILNGHRNPAGAEATFTTALNELIKQSKQPKGTDKNE
jgi:hypothetical protein